MRPMQKLEKPTLLVEEPFSCFAHRVNIYNSQNDYVIEIVGYNNEELEHLIIPETINGFPVRGIRGGTFTKGSKNNLKSIILPNTLDRISLCAFCGCLKLETIIIPRSVCHIDEYAFANCRELKSITIPLSVISLSKGVFDLCGKVVLKVFENSKAHEYAKENNLKFEMIGD